MSVPTESKSETVFKYPCEYPLKVMGRRNECTPELLAALLKGVLGVVILDSAMTQAASGQGNFVSISVTLHLTAEEQRLALYKAISAEKRILFTL
jgi:uncharacterized protein